MTHTGEDPRRPASLTLLVASAFGMHLADQVALVVAPLVAVLVFDASAGVIGLMVADRIQALVCGRRSLGLLGPRFDLADDGCVDLDELL